MDKEEKQRGDSEKTLFGFVVEALQKFKEGLLENKGEVSKELKEDAEELKKLVDLYAEEDKKLRHIAGFTDEDLEELKNNPDKLNLTPHQRRFWDQIQQLKDEISDHKTWLKKELEVAKRRDRRGDTSEKKRPKKFRGLGGKDSKWKKL